MSGNRKNPEVIGDTAKYKEKKWMHLNEVFIEGRVEIMIKTVERKKLHELSDNVKKLVGKGKYLESESLILGAMLQYPHSPQPHNLYGIVLEKEGDHRTAMKHFRAAWALDPTFLPARKNLDYYGTFSSGSGCVYDERDCQDGYQDTYVEKYNDHGYEYMEK